MYSNNIYNIREDLDITQDKLATILGVTQSCITRWENGKEFIPIRKANIISNTYNISLDYLFKLSKNKHINIINKDLDLNLVGQRLVKIRQDNNLTLRALAKELNTSSSTISAYETGKTLLLTAFALQICLKYKVSMDWLYGKIN